MMAGRVRLQKIIDQAKKTFTSTNNTLKDFVFAQNFEKLKEAMNEITAADFNIGPSIADKEWAYQSGDELYKANAACMDIGQCKEFSIGIFLLKDGCGLPLHDHPNMHGCMKVLFGEIEVSSYNAPDKSKAIDIYKRWGGPFVYPCELKSTTRVTEKDAPIVVEPDNGNIHEIQSANGGPVAFLDILAPPYDPDLGRDCNYYYKCSVKEEVPTNNNGNVLHLRPGSSPPGFLCIPQLYPGPQVQV